MFKSLLNVKWKERLKSLSKLPLPDRALKFFPPSFVLRDPVTSLVQRSLGNGDSCALMVFCLEEDASSEWSGPGFWKEPDKTVKGLFTDVLAGFLEKDRILGVKRYGDEDYTVIFKAGESHGYEQLNRMSADIARALEDRLNEHFVRRWKGKLVLQSAAYGIENNRFGTAEAIHAAFRCAYGLATKKLPAHYNSYRLLLTEILNNERISVVTQPIMNLESGEVYGWEVLTRGPVDTPFHLPSNLFEFAHQTNLLTPLEFQVIKQAIRQIACERIRERVFINVTPVTLSHPKLLDYMLEWVEENPGISTHQITIEITERHVIQDYEHMAAILRDYRSHGFRFAVDDAGAGYSSLQTILELVPDIIKIDKSVIRDIDISGGKQSLLKALLYFAGDLNCQVIAEGVEREEEANVLFEHQVHMGQGFYFARPEPIRFDYGHGHFTDLKEKIIRGRRFGKAL